MEENEQMSIVTTTTSGKDLPAEAIAALRGTPTVEQQFQFYCMRKANANPEQRNAYRAMMKKMHSQDEFSMKMLESARACRGSKSLDDMFGLVANILLTNENEEGEMAGSSK